MLECKPAAREQLEAAIGDMRGRFAMMANEGRGGSTLTFCCQEGRIGDVQR